MIKKDITKNGTIADTLDYLFKNTLARRKSDIIGYIDNRTYLHFPEMEFVEGEGNTSQVIVKYVGEPLILNVGWREVKDDEIWNYAVTSIKEQ